MSSFVATPILHPPLSFGSRSVGTHCQIHLPSSILIVHHLSYLI